MSRSMNIFRTTLLAFPIILMAACSQKAETSLPRTVPFAFKESLGKVYLGYLEMQDALVKDDLQAAQRAFMAMHSVLHAMPADALDKDARAAWTVMDAKIMEALHPIAGTEDIGEFRSGFAAFSTELIHAFDTFGVSTTEPVFQFHCPMAQNGKGANWMQKNAEPQNPYYGTSARRCGNKVRSIQG